MIFASKKITIAYLVNNQLKLSFFNHGKSGASLIQSCNLQFSDSEVKDFKILDANAFSKKISNVLDEKRLDLGNLVVLLPEKALFIKGFKITPQLVISHIKQEFISEIPYSEQELALKTIVADGQLQLIAIEKNLTANLRSIFSAEMANVQAILPLPRVVSLLFPQDNPTFLIISSESEFTIFYLIGKTVFFSETKSYQEQGFERAVVAAIEELRHLVETEQTANVALFGIKSRLLAEKLAEAGFQVKDIELEGDLLQLTASLWFTQKLDCLAEDLTLEPDYKPKAGKFLPNIKPILLNSIILLLFAVAGIFVFKSFILPRFQKAELSQTTGGQIATESATIEVSPTPVEATVSAKPADFTVEILNGNGIVGDAARFKEVLQAKGFIVKNTANAKSSDFVTSEINTKSAVPADIISTLDKMLAQSYTQTKVATLSTATEVDVQIILGQKK